MPDEVFMEIGVFCVLSRFDLNRFAPNYIH